MASFTAVVQTAAVGFDLGRGLLEKVGRLAGGGERGRCLTCGVPVLAVLEVRTLAALIGLSSL
jgi:hypothetical protein